MESPPNNYNHVTQMTQFRLPIGDWSGDGHGRCNWYIIESNKPLDHVRECYWKSCKTYQIGFDSEFENGPCVEYQDSRMKKEFIEKLIKIGIKITFPDFECPATLKDVENIDFEEDKYWEEELFLNVILQFISLSDPELILYNVDNNVPTFTFYGYDKNRRHIGYFGYGLFE